MTFKLHDHLIARGADQSRSLALHCATKCQDAEKSTVMIEHLLDKYCMDIDFDNEQLRDNFQPVGESGTPLNSAVDHHNLAAMHKLLARGANPESAEVYTVAEKYELESLKAQVHKNMVKLIQFSGDKPDLIETIREIDH